jgi:hypothetical protein
MLARPMERVLGLQMGDFVRALQIAVILHRLWIDGTTYRGSEAQLMATQA